MNIVGQILVQMRLKSKHELFHTSVTSHPPFVRVNRLENSERIFTSFTLNFTAIDMSQIE